MLRKAGVQVISITEPFEDTPTVGLLEAMIESLDEFYSANLGEEVSVFEPTHGSAPKYADYPVSIVNPIAMIESACLMLDHLGEQEIAKKIRTAISLVVSAGKVRTYDMLKMAGRADVIDQGAASTSDMADAIIKNL